MIGWCTLFIQTVAKDAPATALPEDLTDREANHWWKAKKWAYFNLNRLFVRYVHVPSRNIIANIVQIWKSSIPPKGQW
jgi:hypothetical protein